MRGTRGAATLWLKGIPHMTSTSLLSTDLPTTEMAASFSTSSFTVPMASLLASAVMLLLTVSEI